jgi:hypothetical protein
MVENLYRTLTKKGVTLKTDGATISFESPVGVLTEDDRAQLRAAKQEMINYLIEVEEVAAILELEQGNGPNLARVLACRSVNERRMCESENSDFRRTRKHPHFMAAEAACLSTLGSGLEILSVDRLAEDRRAA